MEIDEYFKVVGEFAARCEKEPIAPETLIEKLGLTDTRIAECVALRSSVIDSAEEEKLTAYLVIGLFQFASNRKQRMALFAFCFEIQHALDVLKLRKQCQRYEKTQPLFANVPALFGHIRHQDGSGNPDFELIDLNAIRPVNGSEIYAIDGGFAKLTRHLNPGIVNWARDTFHNSPVYVRLDPHFFAVEQPLQYLTEATLVPANPKWLANFTLRKGMADAAAYKLEDCKPQDDVAQFWDYRMRGIRRLEVRVARRKDNYLTAMIEELPREDDENGLMVAHCIHLDTCDPAGTPINEVRLQHLDLALNVYEGEQRRRRFNQSLTDGKVVDASFRTHLFRIEQADFLSLFEFCRMFLRSHVLLSEWIQEVIAG